MGERKLSEASTGKRRATRLKRQREMGVPDVSMCACVCKYVMPVRDSLAEITRR
jgi:hypothetical protein